MEEDNGAEKPPRKKRKLRGKVYDPMIGILKQRERMKRAQDIKRGIIRPVVSVHARNKRSSVRGSKSRSPSAIPLKKRMEIRSKSGSSVGSSGNTSKASRNLSRSSLDSLTDDHFLGNGKKVAKLPESTARAPSFTEVTAVEDVSHVAATVLRGMVHGDSPPSVNLGGSDDKKKVVVASLLDKHASREFMVSPKVNNGTDGTAAILILPPSD